jgi:serine phosphatase RsbU (regulator of sigma subunit)/anti-sigma regulatory factor (Ser/Thr protein kinase)
MFNRPIKEVNAEFLAEEQYLDGIRRVVKESCATAGMSRKDTAAVLLAIEEGATNIIRHAYLYEKGMLRLRIVIYKKLIAFSLIDSGRSFEPRGAGKIDLARLVESSRKGGLGFYMIQKIMDSVEYISAAGFNELRMIKQIKRPLTATPPILRRLFTLRVKFSVATFLVFSLIVGCAYYYIDTRTSREVYRHLDGTVEALAKTIADQASGYIINRRSDVEFDELIVSYVRSNPVLKLVVLTDADGMILAHSDDIHNIRKPYKFGPQLDPTRVGVPQRFVDGGVQLNYLMVPIMAGDRYLGMVHATYSSEQLRALLVDARRKILLLTAVLLLIGVAGIYLLSNYFVRPIVRITERVRRFTSGDLETELPLEGADEFFEISRALNDMITRLGRDRRNLIERERMAKEIEVASQIQKTLLPHQLPRIPGLEVETYYRAASMVGGDLYDIFETETDRYCMVVADVSGKGVPASLVMSMLRTVIQIQARNAVSAKETLHAVNDYLARNMPPGMFITVLMTLFDSERNRLHVVSAGHNPMLLYRHGAGVLERINPSGMALGLDVTLDKGFSDGLQEVAISLAPGDTFLMFTDGITEAVNRERRQYGMDRLCTFMLERMKDGAQPGIKEVSQALVEEIDSFSGSTRQSDDITFILARACTRGQPDGDKTPDIS